MMSGMRRRCVLVTTLALLGCGERASVEQPRCSVIAAELLATRLRATDPHDQGRILHEHLEGICDWELLGSYGDHDFGLNPRGEAMFARACPAAPELHAEPISPEQLYDRCDFGRLQIIEREEYRLHTRPDPLLWTLHPWLIENGVTEAAARIITLARLRAELEWFGGIPNLRVPTINFGDPLSPGPAVLISTHELGLEHGATVPLEHGQLIGEHREGMVIMPLYDELELQTEKAKQIAEASGRAWEPELLLAADPSTPYPTIERVAFTARLLGYSRLELIVEPRLFELRTITLALDDPEGEGRRIRVDRVRDEPPACDGSTVHDVILQPDADVDYARLLDKVVYWGRCGWVALEIPLVVEGQRR